MRSKLTFGTWLKFFAVILVASVVVAFSLTGTVDGQPPSKVQQTRTWKDATGTFSIGAKFVRKDGDNVILLNDAGKELTIPIAILSKVDQDHIKKILMPSTPLATPITGTAADVKAMLESRCYYCHGEDGAAEGGVNFILDYDHLVKAKFIVPGEPTRSMLYRQIVLDDMPKDDDPLTEAEKSLIKQWITDGAPSFNPQKPPRAHISPKQVYESLASDVLAQPEDDRPYLRYFSIVHLYNAGVGDDELRTYRNGVSKLVNSLSWGDEIVVPVVVDDQSTILRIDLRDYQWEQESWESVVDQFPYKIDYEFDEYNVVRRETQTLTPIVMTDWFVSAAAVPPLYHDLLEIPETAKELEFLLSVNAELNIERDLVVRAGFNSSGVSGNNRLIERHRTLYGAYWKSYDFDEVDGAASRKNIFERPLGPGGTDGFEHDGGELIFTLPNGLQGYMLVDAKDNRIDKGPIGIVQDDKRPDRQVVNGLSCMSCHGRGLIRKRDQIRTSVDANKLAYEQAFGKEGLEKILKIYPGQEKVDEWIEKDRQKFAEAVEATGGRVTDTEPIVTLVTRFEQEIDLQTAAAEAGLPAKEFARRVKATPDIARSLGVLSVDGGRITRAAYRTLFASMAVALKIDELGQPEIVAGKARPARITPIPGGPEFLLIPAGKFMMGGALLNGKFERPIYDTPLHEVEITKPFYLSVTPITSHEIHAMAGVKLSDDGDVIYENGKKLSREEVSLVRSLALGHPEGLSRLYKTSDFNRPGRLVFLDRWNSLSKIKFGGYRLRLPTEAEWEYAARGGVDLQKWFPSDDQEELLKYTIKLGSPIQPNEGKYLEQAAEVVRQMKPNPFGLYGMVGMHLEMVEDRYEKDYYNKSPLKDPKGPMIDGPRVLRGSTRPSSPNTVIARNPGTFTVRYATDLAAIRLVLEFTDDD